MKREALEKLGLTKEIIDQVMAMHGETLNATKTELETFKAENASLKNTVKEANTQIDGFKKLNIDEIKKTADEWKAKYENDIKAKDLEILKVQKNSALDIELAKYKPRNPNTLKRLLDVEKVELKEGKLVGLEEQIKGLKESEPYLFGEEQVKQSGVGSNLPNFTGLSAEDQAVLDIMGVKPKK